MMTSEAAAASIAANKSIRASKLIARRVGGASDVAPGEYESRTPDPMTPPGDSSTTGAADRLGGHNCELLRYLRDDHVPRTEEVESAPQRHLRIADEVRVEVEPTTWVARNVRGQVQSRRCPLARPLLPRSERRPRRSSGDSCDPRGVTESETRGCRVRPVRPNLPARPSASLRGRQSLGSRSNALGTPSNSRCSRSSKTSSAPSSTRSKRTGSPFRSLSQRATASALSESSTRGSLTICAHARFPLTLLRQIRTEESWLAKQFSFPTSREPQLTMARAQRFASPTVMLGAAPMKQI